MVGREVTIGMELRKPEETKVEKHPWGSLTWYASKELGNSDFTTAGICRILPGAENPRHMHPNCQEILYVLDGEIEHSFGDDPNPVRMANGCAITIPSGVFHNARNVGGREAVLLITFSSAERRTIGE